MSAMENPTTRLDGPEAPIEGYKAIADEAHLSKTEAHRAAREAVDPLPVWKYRGRVIAWPSAIKEWRARHIIPLRVAEKLERVGAGTAGTTGTSIDEDP